MEAYKVEFAIARETANSIAAEEHKEMKPAEYMKSTLIQAYNNLVTGSRLVRAGYAARVDEESSVLAAVDYSKEQREVSELGIMLERIILTQKVEEGKER